MKFTKLFLILLAASAFNSSKAQQLNGNEILKSYNAMENGMNNAAGDLIGKRILIEKAVSSDAQKNVASQKILPRIQSATAIADEFDDYIISIKTDLEKLTGGRKERDESGNLGELVLAGDLAMHKYYFVVENNGIRAKELQDKINKTAARLIGILELAAADPVLSKEENTKRFLLVKKQMLESRNNLTANNETRSDGTVEAWFSLNIEKLPLAGVFAMLSKIQYDCRSLESEVALSMAEACGAGNLVFDELVPIVSTKSSAVLTNQAYEAEVRLGAYNSMSDLKITVNGKPIPVKDGVGKISVSSRTPGEVTNKIAISLPGPSGTSMLKETESKFYVFEPSSKVNATEMNVFYKGIVNPFTAVAASVPPSELVVTVSDTNVKLKTLGDGRYEARVNSKCKGSVTIQVGMHINDRIVNLGSQTFSVLSLPTPDFRAGSVAFKGETSLTMLKVQNQAFAAMDNFAYPGLNYTITSFTCTGIDAAGNRKVVTCNSDSLLPIAEVLNALKTGDFILFSNIHATGPDGADIVLDNAFAQVR